MRSMRPDKDICVRKITIPSDGRRQIPALVLSPKELPVMATGVLWIHGGGYITGMKRRRRVGPQCGENKTEEKRQKRVKSRIGLLLAFP